MLVTRTFLVMGLPVLEIAHHSTCCTTGLCSDPDYQHLESSYEDATQRHGIVGVVAAMLHESISEYTDDILSAVLEDRSIATW